ncbi:MAG: CapA family protein [Clostridia bacterium]|nr:CapA family protein [Clostridia bacterium]
MSNKGKRFVFKQGREYTIRRIATIVILLLIVFALFKVLTKNKNENIAKNDTNSNQAENIFTAKNTTDDNKSVQNEDITFTLATTGDIMCHNTNFQDAYNSSTKSYDFSYYFTDIKQYLQEADITVGNLETTLSGAKRGYSGYPTFNTPEILAKNLKDAGFNLVTTANNHCMDKGYSGIESTIDFLDKADLAHTGTFKSKKDQETILIKNVKGVNIAFLSFTYGTNGIAIPKDKSYAVNLIDKDFIKSQIELAKKQNPDLICVSMHWGIEYQTKANKEQQNLADFLFNNGVDVILGNHSHVPQQMEKRTIKLDDGTTKDGFVIYSLGNFMANQNKQYTNDSAILKLQITKHKDDGKITIDKATYTPTYMFKNTSKSTKKFKILDINSEIKKYESKASDAVSKSLYNTLVTERKNIKRIIGDEIK